MTASAAGTVEEPGHNVGQKSGLNRGGSVRYAVMSQKRTERARLILSVWLVAIGKMPT